MKIKTQKTMKKHISNWYWKSSFNEFIDGLDWYDHANNFACKLSKKYNCDISKVSQVIALLSPQVNWETNKANAERIIKCWFDNDDFMTVKIFATEVQKANCIDCLNGLYTIPVTAMKTYSFAMNINQPKSNEYVTIDRHAVKVALNDLKGGGVALTKKNYLEISKAYKSVAKKLGTTPSQLQGIVWITYKNEVNR